MNALIILASALRERILKRKQENKIETKQLVISYDDPGSDAVYKVNELLKSYWLEFVWDGKDYDDYSERYDLVKIQSDKE